MNLLNLTTVSFPSSTLYEEEINVLVSVANRFIEKYPESSRQILKGSFKLIGKHRSGTATDIMSFDFPGGTELGYAYPSDILATAAAERAVETHESITFHDSKNKTTDAIVIDTKYGCFALGICMIPRDLGYSFLLQMAISIGELGFSYSTDRTLQFSIDSIHITNKDDRYEVEALGREFMGNHFSSEEIKVWRKWKNSHARIKGENLGFFFEEYEKASPRSFDRYNDLSQSNSLKPLRLRA